MMRLTHRSRAVGIVACLALSTVAWRAEAAPLTIGSFASLGAFPTLAGTYTINTDTLAFGGPGGFSAFGVDAGGIAVFAFDGGAMSGITINATGSRTLALLFHGDVNFSGTLNANGADGGGSGGAGGPGGGAGGDNGANGGGPGGGTRYRGWGRVRRRGRWAER